MIKFNLGKECLVFNICMLYRFLNHVAKIVVNCTIVNWGGRGKLYIRILSTLTPLGDLTTLFRKFYLRIESQILMILSPLALRTAE